MCRFLDYGLSFTRARDALLLADRAEQEKDSQRTKTEKVQAFLCSEVIYQTQAAVASDGHRVV